MRFERNSAQAPYRWATALCMSSCRRKPVTTATAEPRKTWRARFTVTSPAPPRGLRNESVNAAVRARTARRMWVYSSRENRSPRAGGATVVTGG